MISPSSRTVDPVVAAVVTGCIAKKKHGLQKNYRMESSVLILYSGKSGLFARALRCLDACGKKLRLGCPRWVTRIARLRTRYEDHAMGEGVSPSTAAT